MDLTRSFRFAQITLHLCGKSLSKLMLLYLSFLIFAQLHTVDAYGAMLNSIECQTVKILHGTNTCNAQNDTSPVGIEHGSLANMSLGCARVPDSYEAGQRSCAAVRAGARCEVCSWGRAGAQCGHECPRCSGHGRCYDPGSATAAPSWRR